MDWYLYLDCLYLGPELRGLGLGKQLMLTAAAHAKKLGIKQMQWQTPEDNHNAIAFYNKLGASNKAKQRFFWQL
jgi:ribosomal protein S18 acetylase RimI-like enzyme